MFNLKNRNLEWFPKLKAISIGDGEEENDIGSLKARLEATNSLVVNLTNELSEIKDWVNIL